MGRGLVAVAAGNEDFGASPVIICLPVGQSPRLMSGFLRLDEGILTLGCHLVEEGLGGISGSCPAFCAVVSIAGIFICLRMPEPV